ncbi:MAG: GNAT family N-acetyltransferase [Pseudomonadota bacterium]
MSEAPRKLSLSDLDSIYDIAEETLVPLWSKKEYGFFLSQPSSFCWGIEERKELACFLLTLSTGTEIDVVAIATRKNIQGRGIAKKLLEWVLRLPQIEQAFLEVDPANEPAVKLYLGSGFKVLGIRKKYYGGKKDAWVMKWER